MKNHLHFQNKGGHLLAKLEKKKKVIIGLRHHFKHDVAFFGLHYEEFCVYKIPQQKVKAALGDPGANSLSH